MPTETRYMSIQKDSLIEKVRGLSPGSHTPMATAASTGASALGSSPELIRSSKATDPAQVSMGDLYQLIQQLTLSVNQQKESFQSEIKNLNDRLSKYEDSMQAHVQTVGDAIKAQIKSSVDDLQLYVDQEISRVTTRLDDFQTRLTALEEKETPDFDPEVSVILSKVPFTVGENIQEKVETIVHRELGLPQIRVVRSMRLPQRNNPQARGVVQPPLVKVQLANLEEKKIVLRAKLRLNTSALYSNVWIRSSKSHAERLNDLNFRTILGMIPGGNNMKVTANGKIVPKTVNDNVNVNNANAQ